MPTPVTLDAVQVVNVRPHPAPYSKLERAAIGMDFLSTETEAAANKVLRTYGSVVVRRGLLALAAVAEHDGDRKLAKEAMAWRDSIPVRGEGTQPRPTFDSKGKKAPIPQQRRGGSKPAPSNGRKTRKTRKVTAA